MAMANGNSDFDVDVDVDFDVNADFRHFATWPRTKTLAAKCKTNSHNNNNRENNKHCLNIQNVVYAYRHNVYVYVYVCKQVYATLTEQQTSNVIAANKKTKQILAGHDFRSFRIRFGFAMRHWQRQCTESDSTVRQRCPK